ncbi:MAG: DUF4143 domain-containing protein [Planctomycetes bacterium]|nr:DUF4143 domain-containing protein [Planctomycetota bacterium]
MRRRELVRQRRASWCSGLPPAILFMVRQLSAWCGTSAKRLVRAPKIYIRDSGLLHSSLNIQNTEELLGHPICGHSWEGFAIEQMVGALSDRWRSSFYRTSAGAEIDLVLGGPQGRVIALEIKRATAPTPTAASISARRMCRPPIDLL